MGGKDVRIMTGYGPQENWTHEEKMPFFRSLEQEIIKAKLHGKLIFIQMQESFGN